MSTIGFGTDAATARDVLGQVDEYFLGMFASAEGKRGGQFYTPVSIVKTLVAVLAPHHGKVYDPCCGSGGMFVQSGKFIEAHGGNIDNVVIFGQEANPTTWRLGGAGVLGAAPASVRWWARLERKYLCAFGDVSPHDGLMDSLVLPWVSAETMRCSCPRSPSATPRNSCSWSWTKPAGTSRVSSACQPTCA